MINILEEFARGNTSVESCFFKRGSRYGRVMKTLSDNEEKLLTSLSGEAKKRLKSLLKRRQKSTFCLVLTGLYAATD